MNHHNMHPYSRAARMRQMADERYEQEMRHEREAFDEGDLPMREDEEKQEAAQAAEAAAQEEKAPEEAAPAAQELSQEEKSQLEDMRLRMAAEMDNFKKRLAREHQEQMRYASEKVLSDLLPALDNLDLALQYGSQHEACQDMMQGIEMTRRQLLEALAKNGLTSIGQQGEMFNPEMHEAIGVEQHSELEKGAVSRVMQRGYKLNDRLLRPAKVMVNN